MTPAGEDDEAFQDACWQARDLIGAVMPLVQSLDPLTDSHRADASTRELIHSAAARQILSYLRAACATLARISGDTSETDQVGVGDIGAQS